MQKFLDPRILFEFEERAGFPLAVEVYEPKEAGQLVFLANIGSHSHGTYVAPTDPQAIDDVDYMGVVIPPRSRVIGLHEWEHVQFQKDELDVVIYSFQKFIRLLLKSNPNVLGTLWLRPESYVVESMWSDELIERRDVFSSLMAYPAFIGYAHGQFERMTNFNQELLNRYRDYLTTIANNGLSVKEVLDADANKLKHLAAQSGTTPDFLQRFRGLHRQHFQAYMGDKRKALVQKYGYDCKNAAHLIRLMRMCVEFLYTGELTVYRTVDGEYIRAIKSGQYPLEYVKKEAEALFEEARIARDKSPLPKEPDALQAEEMLIGMTLEAWGLHAT